MWNQSAGVGRWFWTLGAGLALATALPGCLAHSRGEVVYDYPVTYVDAPPPRIEVYPRTQYHGRPAYLVDGRWYYHSHDRWAVFREEPNELRDYRMHSAPAASSRYYADAPGRHGHRELEQRRAWERAERQRVEERRAAEQRAEMRRAQERRQERLVAESRARARDVAERRAAERRAAEHRTAERRAEQRRIEERRNHERRAERERRIAEQKNRDARKRERPRRDGRDDDTDDRHRMRND